MSLRIPVEGLFLAPAQPFHHGIPREMLRALHTTLATSSGEASLAPRGNSPHKVLLGRNQLSSNQLSSSPSIAALPPQTPPKHSLTPRHHRAALQEKIQGKSAPPGSYEAEKPQGNAPSHPPKQQQEGTQSFLSLPSAVPGRHPPHVSWSSPRQLAIPCLPAPPAALPQSPKPQPGRRHFITLSPGFLNA